MMNLYAHIDMLFVHFWMFKPCFTIFDLNLIALDSNPCWFWTFCLKISLYDSNPFWEIRIHFLKNHLVHAQIRIRLGRFESIFWVHQQIRIHFRQIRIRFLFSWKIVCSSIVLVKFYAYMIIILKLKFYSWKSGA